MSGVTVTGMSLLWGSNSMNTGTTNDESTEKSMANTDKHDLSTTSSRKSSIFSKALAVTDSIYFSIKTSKTAL